MRGNRSGRTGQPLGRRPEPAGHGLVDYDSLGLAVAIALVERAPLAHGKAHRAEVLRRDAHKVELHVFVWRGRVTRNRDRRSRSTETERHDVGDGRALHTWKSRDRANRLVEVSAASGRERRPIPGTPAAPRHLEDRSQGRRAADGRACAPAVKPPSTRPSRARPASRPARAAQVGGCPLRSVRREGFQPPAAEGSATSTAGR